MEIKEPDTMKLYDQMPIVHFKPEMEYKKKTSRVQYYECPCYMYPDRKGENNRPSYQFYMELKCERSPEVWIKRGTALLMNIGDE